MILTKEEAVSRARSLAPAIRERATESEQLRQPHDDSIKDLIDADLLGLLVPKAHGGHELGFDAIADVVFEISRACMSTGWVAAFYIGHNWVASRATPEAQEEVFSGKNYACIAASSAPTLKASQADGGWRISGSVPWGSGITHADWTIVAGTFGGGDTRTFVVPIQDARIDDTWNMTGMSGTGSHDIVFDDVFVPEHRAQLAKPFGEGATAGAKMHKNPSLYEIPTMPFSYCETIGVFAGGLRGAVDAFHEAMQIRVRNFSEAVVREKPISHLQLGEAYAIADVVEELMQGQIRLTQEAAERGMTMQDRIKLKAHMGFVVDLCRTGINQLISNSGATSFRRELPLQRFFRDINMLSTHAFFEWSTGREQYGRNLLGLEPTHPLI